MNDINIDQLLDGTLDDLLDAPEFKPFPAGVHKVTLKLSPKDGKEGKVSYVLDMTALETVELKDAGAAPLEKGATTNIWMTLVSKNALEVQMGQGKFKEIMAAAAAHFGAKSNRELVADINGAEALVVTGIRKGKDQYPDATTLVGIEFV